MSLKVGDPVRLSKSFRRTVADDSPGVVIDIIRYGCEVRVRWPRSTMTSVYHMDDLELVQPPVGSDRHFFLGTQTELYIRRDSTGWEIGSPCEEGPLLSGDLQTIASAFSDLAHFLEQMCREQTKT